MRTFKSDTIDSYIIKLCDLMKDTAPFRIISYEIDFDNKVITFTHQFQLITGEYDIIHNVVNYSAFNDIEALDEITHQLIEVTENYYERMS